MAALQTGYARGPWARTVRCLVLVFLLERLVDVDGLFAAESRSGVDIAFQLHRASNGLVFDAEELAHVVAGEGGAFDEFRDGERHVAQVADGEPDKATAVLEASGERRS